MVEGVATGRYRAYLDTGVNVVDVRDVARGHLLALEHGRSGERYLLGGVDLTLRELFGAIADLAGRRRPRVRIPYAAAKALARTGVANAEEVVLARMPMYFSSDRPAASSATSPGRSSPRSPARCTRRSVLAMAEPLEGLPDRDHGDEDQADDKHREDDVPPLLGDISGREERSDHTATLTDSAAVRVERRRQRVLANLAHDRGPAAPTPRRAGGACRARR